MDDLHRQVRSVRLATVQPPMHATLDANVDAIEATLTRLAEQDVDAALFPELALTGFHRGLRDLCEQPTLAAARTRLQASVDRLGVAAIVGLPHPTDDGWQNAAAILVPGQPERLVAKVGLTPSEATFFSPGAARPVFDLHGLRTTVVFCREVLDELELDADLILWPGYIQWDGDNDYLRAAQALARRTGAHLVQSNWPSSLNAPDTLGLGGSVVLTPDGVEAARLPFDGPDIHLVRL